jgi:hypothetical protein
MRFVVVLLFCASPIFAKPAFKDIQASHGQLGPERKNLECLRGDELYFRFTVVGFTTNDDGRLAGELAYSVTDASGKVVLKDAVAIQQTLALGGGTFPGHASVTIGEEMPVGEYTFKVTITDNLARASDSFERKFTCKAQEFALVAVRFSQDAEGRIPATVGGIVSQTLFIKARGVGFDKSKGELDLEMSIQVFDAKGKPVMPKPIRSLVHNEDPNVVKAATVINLRGELTLNRPGEFVLKIALTDTIAKKTATFEVPLKVTKP